MRRFELITLIVILVLGGAMAPVHAATIFTDAGLFETATGGSTLVDDYNDFTITSTLPGVTNRSGYTITEAAGTLIRANGGSAQNVDGTGHLVIGFSPTTARFDFAAPIAAMAFEYRTNSSSLEFTVDSGSFSTSASPTTTAQFIGVIFDSPVTSVDVSNISGTIGNIGVDNLRTATTVIPEPTSISLAMLGIGTLLLRRRGTARTRRA